MSALIINDVASTPTAKLLEFFNANTGGNQVTKFRDRQTAEKRVLALIAEMAAEDAGDQAAAKEACKRGGEVLEDTPAADVGFGDKLEEDEKAAAFVPEAPMVAAPGSPTAAKPLNRDSTKPWQRAKQLVCDMTAAGKGTRKEIIAAGIAAGIKYNTIDGAYYSMIVQPRNEKR